MRLALTADTNEGLASRMAARYDNAPFFVLVDIDPQDPAPRRVRGVENPWWGAHAAPEVATFLPPMRVSVVITGSIAPRDARYLQAAEIYPVTGAAGTVSDGVRAFLAGELDGAEACLQGMEREALESAAGIVDASDADRIGQDAEDVADEIDDITEEWHRRRRR